MPITIQEAIRVFLGAVRPEIRSLARKSVDFLPEELRKEWIGRMVGSLAQIVERLELKGFQEPLSDVIEIISDEIGKQVRERREKKEEIDFMKELKRLLENTKERLKKAENIEDEKNRIIAEIEAYQSIIEVFKKIEEKFILEPEKKADWEKIFKKISEMIGTVKEKGLEGLKEMAEKIKEKYPEIKEEMKKQKNEFLEGWKEGWREGRRKGLI